MKTTESPFSEKSDVKGRLSEAKFFQIVQSRPLAPWVVGIWPAPPHHDAKGVDANAWVTHMGNKELIRVPIQIKGSRAGVNKHFLSYKNQWAQRLVTIRMYESMGHDAVRSILIPQLLPVHRGQYDYKEFYHSLERARIPIEILTALAAATREHLLPYLPPGAERFISLK